ncbi:toxin co-regulated pilus biosynthesis Q family protein [Luteimonas aquatica]|uniref:toxin co-regulated pilus biosynthesis Q family protein n=1 Tax=Luteimonas aquatica TaxID=450364 RepID=UPI001F5827A4|nr:toxin co-regulated pilus biosynthesis Q family protein [Luteimonas aquatica]
MKKRISLLALIPLALVLASCATRPAPDISGRWKPVNRFSETTEAIPLYQNYAFYPSPMDGTLKNMLTRWARDSKLTLSYLHPSDFTLYAQVSDIHTLNLQEAISQLNTAYAAQGVSISSDGRQIVVRPSGGSEAQAAPAAP